MKTAKAICIKEYHDEDSLEECNLGEIEFEDIITYKVGDIDVVVIDFYDKKYWKLM